MLSLHEATDLTKKVAMWGGIAIVVLILLILTFRAGRAIKNYFLPPGPPPPTVAYGRLTAVDFPENVTKEKLEYTLDTISGVLPTFPTQLKVYKILHNTPGLLSFEQTRDKVGQVGFGGKEVKVSDDVYQWSDESPITRTIKINTTTQNFSLISFYSNYAPVINGTNLPDESGSVEIAKDFLGTMGLLPEDIDISKTTTELYTLENGIILPATSLSTAKIIRVDFFQKDLDDIPMYYPNPPHSSLYFLVGGGNVNPGPRSIIEAKFYHQLIDNKGETYPIKTAEQALRELQNGKGYIASFFGSSHSVKITDVTLGYYLSDSEQDFLMPVIVFHGDSNFFAYVPGVKNEWVK